ncbi:MAG: carbohydrate-binding domain-containing protein [Prevotella sp.]|nr:carbohydrate-binding domain-containing protein [Prevotella sp.]
MKRILVLLVSMMGIMNMMAVENNTVEVIYNGSTANVLVADNIASYITVSSGTSSHVVIKQSADFAGIDPTKDNDDGEIFYVLSGSSDDGEFYLEGSYKCEVDLNGLTLTNPIGPALNIQNGKRIDLSAKKGTQNTLADGKNTKYNGCITCKGHLKFKGKGSLDIAGNNKHAIASDEYMEIKNLTLNITSAPKDGIHCKQYFLMESGTVTISGAKDDGIQCELDGTKSTGELTGHEDEDSGNVYLLNGTLTISNYEGKAIKADGTISYIGGTQNFDTSDTSQATAIASVAKPVPVPDAAYYDLGGRKLNLPPRGIYIHNRKKVVK